MSKRKPLPHKGRRLEVEMRTTATPQQVWEAWTDPEKIAQWFTDGASGEPVEGTTFTWTFDKFGYVIPYTVAAAVPYEQFALHFSGMGKEGILEVVIEHAGGETVMRLVNSGFNETGSWDEEYEGIDSGWHNASAVLKLYLERYFGRRKTSTLVMRPAQFTYEQLRRFQRTADGLSRWLTTAGTVSEHSASLLLRDGSRLTGSVLAMTPMEVALGWDEIEGTLELKAFSGGPGKRMLGLRALSWNGNESLPSCLEPMFAAALDALARELAPAL